MQTLTETPFEYRVTLGRAARIFRFLWRYLRKEPEVLEPFLASLAEEGVPESNLSNARAMCIALRKVYHDEETAYRLDRYLVTGIAAVDLLLIPVIIPMGVPDQALFIALLSLAISLVLVSCSLFVVFVKADLKINSYGKVHSWLIFLSLLSGVTALTATIWHSSSLIGAVFLILAVLGYLACLSYVTLVRTAVAFLQLLEVIQAPPDNNEQESPPTGRTNRETGVNSTAYEPTTAEGFRVLG
jgi:hypothetical protein